MGRFDTTKATINANIKKNGNQEITGSILNSVMTEMVDATDAQLTELSAENKEALLYATNKCVLDIPSANAGSYETNVLSIKKDFQYTIIVEPLQTFDGEIIWGLRSKSGNNIFVEQLLITGGVGKITFVADEDYEHPILFFWSAKAKPSLSCEFRIDNPNILDIDSRVKGMSDLRHRINLAEQDIDKILTGSITDTLASLPSHEGYIDELGNIQTASNYRYVYIPLEMVQSIRFEAPSFGNNGTATINALDSDKNFLENMVIWGNLDNIEYNMYLLPKGASYLAVSVPAIDISAISYYIHSTSMSVLVDSVEKLEDEQLYIYAKIRGGDVAFKTDNFPIVNGKYIDANGNAGANNNFSYVLIPRRDADAVVLSGNLIDTCIVNLIDDSNNVVANVGEWIKLYDLTIASETYKDATRICLSFNNIDIDNITISYRYVGNDVASSSFSDEMMARYDAAYNKALADDKPLIKGLFIDCGRKYFSLANLKKFIDVAADAKLNTFFYYFSDNQGFRFALNDMSVNVNDSIYDLSVCLGDGVGGGDGTNKWITETEMDDLIAYAKSKDIQIIPAFDMPGHMGAIRQHFNTAEFMESTEKGRKWMVAVYEKYVSYFAGKGCQYFNICGDEYGGEKDVYVKIITQLVHCVTSYGLIPMLYNDEICRGGYFNPYISNGAIILGWNKGDNQASFKMILDSGYKMINAKQSPYYWILGVAETTDSLLAAIRTTNPYIMADGTEDKDVQGAVYHIWCDLPAADGADEGNNVFEQTQSCIRAFGQNMQHYFPCNYMPKDHICMKDANGEVYKVTISTSGEIIISKFVA